MFLVHLIYYRQNREIVFPAQANSSIAVGYISS